MSAERSRNGEGLDVFEYFPLSPACQSINSRASVDLVAFRTVK